ncbi:MAG: hypothetical protein PHE25_02895 [Candidatus Gracilibacteria bacterium]|nr:hypothetical protein [Candidatus Gracilibacteria bacterium]
MKIIISKTFESDFKKFISKNYSNCNLIKFTSILYKFIITKGLYLNRPFMKLKFDFCNKAVRLLVYYDKDNSLIIPIFITDKNDKIYGYNMTWNTIKEKALNLFKNISNDIKNDEFNEF